MTQTSKTRKSNTGNGRSQGNKRTGSNQIVLVFQGGGALGAYQAGVYQALHESGIEPDWVIGTSIGAINAALIVGNERDNRLRALRSFWERVSHKSPWHAWPAWPGLAQSMSYVTTIANGIPGFFEPNRHAFGGPHVRLGADSAGYYSTKPLENTLLDLVDFPRINKNSPRLTVGAAHVRTSKMKYFDSVEPETEIGVKHIMASGALPPAFPAVRIDGDLYWDGGILSNTPAEVVFDDSPRRNSLVFAVHVWNPVGTEPETMWEVMHRQKDIQYSSRVVSHIDRQQQIHRLRHIIAELAARIPDAAQHSKEVQDLIGYGCITRMHVVRLLSPSLDREDHTKDVDFSPSSIRQRWEAGYEKALRAIEQAPWRGDFDPLDGVLLHELDDDAQPENPSDQSQDHDADNHHMLPDPVVHPT